MIRAIVLACLVAAPTYAAGPDWKSLNGKPEAWYRSAEGLRVVGNVLSHQAVRGGWPKNLDTTATSFADDRSKIAGTFDNDATVGEVRFLAKAFGLTRNDACRAAVEKAIDHILEAQYPSGGWPQFFPPGIDYHRFITLNDDTMVNLLVLLRDVAKTPLFSFVDEDRRARSLRAFDRGIACVVACQIKTGGVLTVWCAQHDEVTLKPRSGRAFEPVSLSGAESAGILMLLMSLDTPSPEVIRAVDAGAAWFAKTKIGGKRQTVVNGDKVLIDERTAPPIWARFYELATNRPIFAGRDRVIKYSMPEIESERRNGYAWYGNWGERVAKRYESWKPLHTGK